MSHYLPLDIIGCIVDELSNDFSSLRSLALACSSFLPLCQKHLFRHVNLGSHVVERCPQFHQILVHHPYLGPFVETLCISLADNNHCADIFSQAWRQLPTTLHQLTHLRVLQISHFRETVIGHDDLEQSLLQVFSLPTLEEVILDSAFWFPLHYFDKFLSVQRLTLSFVHFAISPKRQFSTEPPCRKHQLKSVMFRYCHSDVLRRFLKHVQSPNATLSLDKVEEFTLIPWDHEPPAMAIEILELCKQTVRELTWSVPSHHSSHALRLGEFTSLEQLTVIGDLDGSDNVIRNLTKFFDNHSHGLPPVIRIQLTVPTTSRLIGLLHYDWQTIDAMLLRVRTGKIHVPVDRLSMEFVFSPVLICDTYTRTGIEIASSVEDLTQALCQKFETWRRKGVLDEILVTHKEVWSEDRILRSRR